MALFDDDPLDPDTAPQHRLHPLDLYSVPEARKRIMRLLAEGPDGQTLDRLLPERTGDAGGGVEAALKWRSAWTSTFVASLELAKAGKVRLTQDEGFAPIRVQQGADAALLHGSAVKPGKAIERFQQDTFGATEARLIKDCNNSDSLPNAKRSIPFWAESVPWA